MARAPRSPKLSANPTLIEAMRQKHQGSGLSDEHASRLGLRALDAGEVQAALASTKPQAGGMLIPYFDFGGKPTKFFRVRYLESLPGFAGVVARPQRYVQPAKTLNEVYMPPLLDRPWKEIAKDASVTIYVTEGELKAAAACAHGLATVGLGGVDVFRATKRGVELLPQLAEITWENRSVVIVYDSDAATNPNVVRAQRTLAAALVSHGALPAVASLPPAKDGAKQGLDDLLVAEGPDALRKILAAAPAFPEAASLWELNEEVLYVRDPGFVVELATGQCMDPGRFASHHYSNRHYTEIVFNKDGAPVAKSKPLAKRWVDWEGRSEVQRVTYAPGKPRLIEGQHNTYNTWTGWGVEPAPGDITPWTTILDHFFKGKPDERRYFEQWCAFPLQNPGVKLFVYVLLWSVATGTGKSFCSYALKGIYGKNAVEIGNDALKAGFNDWQATSQFVIGDEITAGGDARMDADKLKRLICQPEIRINQKFLPVYRVPDCINYWFNSNHPDSMFLEDQDRRGFIHRVPDERLSEGFWKKADAWLNKTPRGHDGPGLPALFHHLLTLDLTGFNPSAPAPMTAAKEEMIRSGKSSLGAWVAALKEDPVTYLRPLGEKAAAECALFTPRQLLRCFDPEGRSRVSEPAVGREMTRSSFKQVNEATPVRVATGVSRLYAVRDAERWLSAEPQEIAAHYNSFFGPEAGKF